LATSSAGDANRALIAQDGRDDEMSSIQQMIGVAIAGLGANGGEKADKPLAGVQRSSLAAEAAPPQRLKWPAPPHATHARK
jgi:hypothetical protein